MAITTTSRAKMRAAVLRSWAHTPDRAARTAAARKASTSGLDYWLARLDPRMDTTDEATRLKAAYALRRAHYVEMAVRSAAARRSKGSAT